MAHRILIVEDDLHTRRILKTLLMTEPVLSKAEIVEAGDGAMALAQFDRGKIHLVVTDIMMPGMDGVEFCTRLRKHPAGLNVPVLITSSGVRDPVQVERLKSEFNAEFFAKPFEVRAIVRAMLRALSEGPRKAPAPAPAPTVAPAAAPAPPPKAAPPVAAAPSETATKRIVSAARVGKLASESPSALLLDACEQRTSGTLVLLRGNMQKQISLRLGAPVGVESNLRNETLGHYLVSRGVLDDAKHQEALAMAREQRLQLGQVLVKKGWLTEPDLMKHLAAQMKAKLVHVLRWPDGDWQLFAGEPQSRGLELPIDTPSVVFSGLQRSAHVDEIAPRYVTAQGRLKLTPRGERFRSDFDRTFGAGCLDAMLEAESFGAMMASGDPMAILVQLDTLVICGLATLEASAEQRAAPTAPTPVIKEELPTLAKQTAAPQPAAAPANLYDQLFEGNDAADANPTAEIESLKHEIAGAFVNLRQKTFYEVLGVLPVASVQAISDGYAKLSQQFRLERFAGKDLGAEYARLDDLIAVHKQAFETLSDPARRAAYDDELAGRARPATPRLDADLLAQEAARLLANGEAKAAAQKLVHAVALAPTEADYQALLAWATFTADGTTRESLQKAEVHAKEALRINPDNSLAHEYLGRMHAALDDKPRAFDLLNRAIDLDVLSFSAMHAFEEVARSAKDWKRLELRLRKTLHRLNDPSSLRVQLDLWCKLGDLYARELADPDSARMAYSMMHELDASDPRSEERLASLKR